MSPLMNLFLRLRGLFTRRDLEADLETELAHHLEMKRRDLEREGLTPDAARSASHRAVGNTTRWKEQTREIWSFRYLESLFSDASYAFRMLRKDRIFAVVGLTTLALGIGATTAIFSLVNGLFLRPLPVERPLELVRLVLTNLPPTERQWVNGRAVRPKERMTIPFPMYEALGRRQQVFAGMFGSGGGGSMHIELNGVPMRLRVSVVTGSFFPLMGVQPQRGRLLEDSDDVPGGPPSGWPAVISDSMWTRMFSRSPQTVGASISIERAPFAIAGIAPPSFKGTDPGTETDIWIPLSSLESMFPWKWRTDRSFGMMLPRARLKTGITMEQAAQHLAAIAPAVLEDAKDPAMPAPDQKHFLAMKIEPRDLRGTNDRGRLVRRGAVDLACRSRGRFIDRRNKPDQPVPG